MALIEKCDICQQRSELQNSFGRMICGDCVSCMQNGETAKRAAEFGFKEDRFGGGATGGRKSYTPGPGDLVKGMNGNGPDQTPRQTYYQQVERTEEDDEREKYLGVIDAAQDDKWIRAFVKEVLKKQVLEYDWKLVLGNKRWFTTLELRRFALKLNPEFEKPLPPEEDEEELPPLVVGPENPGEDEPKNEENEEPVNAEASDN